jgi:hypothetical protein
MSAFDRHIGHRRHWRRHEIRTLLHDAGFKVERVTGVGFPFFNLYRSLVILRGKKLIDESTGRSGADSLLARAALGSFHVLIRPGLNSTRWGWQMIATARPQ